MEAAYPLFPPYASRAPWWGADLQTVRNALISLAPAATDWPSQDLELALCDGSGDRLATRLQRPLLTSAAAAKAGLPPVVLVHGLGGDETSNYMETTARLWLEHGHAVLRLNLRGAGRSRPLCRFQYHAGRSADLRDALAAFAACEPELAQAGMLLVGYSLGGNLVLKLLGELGQQPAREFQLVGAAAVSAPIDLEVSSRRFLEPRNRFYQRHMLQRLKREATAEGAEVSAAERRGLLATRTIWEFDEAFVAPRGGFADALDYYAQSSAIHRLDAIRVPTLVIHALDDPWIPVRSYRDRDWSEDSAARLLLAPGGGHVGFHGRGSPIPWHDRCIQLFFDGLCGAEVAGEPQATGLVGSDGS